MPNERTGETPHELSRTEIREIVDAYAAAALRVCRGEFDGAELALFGDMLPDEFLSPLVNRRTDEYGGSIENRLRFSCQIVCAVRDAVGPGFVVGVRLSADDFQEGELSRAERLEAAPDLSLIHI